MLSQPVIRLSGQHFYAIRPARGKDFPYPIVSEGKNQSRAAKMASTASSFVAQEVTRRMA